MKYWGGKGATTPTGNQKAQLIQSTLLNNSPNSGRGKKTKSNQLNIFINVYVFRLLVNIHAEKDQHTASRLLHAGKWFEVLLYHPNFGQQACVLAEGKPPKSGRAKAEGEVKGEAAHHTLQADLWKMKYSSCVTAPVLWACVRRLYPIWRCRAAIPEPCHEGRAGSTQAAPICI